MIKPHKPIWNNLVNDTRYFVVTGGRGSGKSFEVNRFLTLLTFEQKQKILLTRQTMTSAHLSIIPEFKEKIDLLELNFAFDIKKSEVTNLQTGSEIIFKGLKTSSGDQTANLKSLQGITTWVIDESEELVDENIFDKIDLSLRTKGIQTRVILILNPTTKTHWIYKRFFETAGVQEGFSGLKNNVTYIHTTYLNNVENLDKNFISVVEKIKLESPEKYNHQILGGWLEKSEGVVITNWQYGDFDKNLPYSFGADFGFSIDPSTLVKVAIDKNKKIIYVDELLYKSGLITTEIAMEYSMNCKKHELIVADSAEPRLIAEIKSRGFNIQPTEKGAGSIKAGIDFLLDYKIIITENSVNLAKEFNNYSYSSRKAGLFIDDYNHAIDALRYNVFFHLTNPNKGKRTIL